MPLCVHVTRDGSPCARHAKKNSKFCLMHKKSHSPVKDRGVKAPAKVLGVPAKYSAPYQEYLASPRPFDLRHQYATINALYLELRDIMETQAERRAMSLCLAVEDKVSQVLKGDPEKLAVIAKKVSEIVEELLPLHFPMTNALSVHDIDLLADKLEQISRVAMTMKKIQEGVKLEVSIDVDFLVRYLQQVILPILPTSDLRRQAAIRTRAFAGGRFNPEEVEILSGLLPAGQPSMGAHTSGTGPGIVIPSPDAPHEELESTGAESDARSSTESYDPASPEWGAALSSIDEDGEWNDPYSESGNGDAS